METTVLGLGVKSLEQAAGHARVLSRGRAGGDPNIPAV